MTGVQTCALPICFPVTIQLKLITEFENYVLKEDPISELDRTISEDGHVVSYALTCRSNEHQFINLKQVDDDYIRFEMYFENIRIQSDYFFTNETPETQMKIIKRLFENTLSDYVSELSYLFVFSFKCDNCFHNSLFLLVLFDTQIYN